MAKSPMKLMLRAWNKELKNPEWGMGNRKHRKACARDFAGASIETDADIPNQAEADDRLAEELTYWTD
ncbi:hypothetical protein ABN262_03240 [Citrobacter youngae]|jgi:hypothetical protein|uniref:hypothetical protein n=1 Tax=Citrobacter TaxID=544 RepID=UPI0006525B04|nr:MULTISPECIES: hypothetical protein [Citrobacter freundii complex]EBS3866377.1 hypothetical protein [Salmonella enterica subsp. enterica serovar Kimberley]ELH8508457.1 hypothetical protein [Salmonella enterica]EEE9158841.1 hypothetical protein [Salmonella enterica subsp. enterica serovar Kimberley]KLV65953.1 hypothetical protein SK36_00653 [Citrobacter sp. MGH106]MDL4457648.1 hypothetical protein [Citrobacter youngae]